MLCKNVGALGEDLNATTRPPSPNYLFIYLWILVFLTASLWWRQGSFKPGSAHGRLLSQRCPLSAVLACWRIQGWGLFLQTLSFLGKPTYPLTGLRMNLSTKDAVPMRRQWSSFSHGRDWRDSAFLKPLFDDKGQKWVMFCDKYLIALIG